ncbi:hypothetical protein [Streptomyces sp. NPDC059513]|uniref:vWA domain-containing protein n=1 Tax=unclassified Streptomyces TaxID=2593676 RepID=UPI0036947519
MSDKHSLTISRTPVPKATLAPTKAREPHVAVVYTTTAGDVDCFDGRPVAVGRLWFSKYRERHEVDLRSFLREVRLGRDPLVSGDGVHHFEVRVSFEYQLDGLRGAEEWVRSGLDDALPTVDNHIKDVCHGAGEAFSIEDTAGLAAELQARFSEATDIGAGLVSHRARVTVRPDAESAAFVKALLEAGRRERTGRAEHVTHLAEQRRLIELDTNQRTAEIIATRQHRYAFDHLLASPEDLINQHLAMHPTDTAGAMEMRMRLESVRAERAERQETQAKEMLDLLVNEGIMLAADFDARRDQFLGLAARAAGAELPAGPPGPAAPPVTASTPWHAPLGAGAAAGITPAGASGTAPAPSALDGGTYEPTFTGPPSLLRTPETPAAALIYLVLDESQETSCLDQLNRGLRSLHEGLSADQAASAALRLCVIGMADDASLRSALEEVGSGICAPTLVHRPGLSYERAFRTLRALLPQDVTLVRAQGAKVLRPLVFFLSGGVPAEGDKWPEALHALTDEAGHPSAPRIIACGLGAADPRAISRIASRPELAHMAPRLTEPATAATAWAAFVHERISDYGRRLAAGGAQFDLAGPDGFRPATDAL